MTVGTIGTDLIKEREIEKMAMAGEQWGTEHVDSTHVTSYLKDSYSLT